MQTKATPAQSEAIKATAVAAPVSTTTNPFQLSIADEEEAVQMKTVSEQLPPGYTRNPLQMKQPSNNPFAYKPSGQNPLQPKTNTQNPLRPITYSNPFQRKGVAEETIQPKKENNTGLPDNLKSGVEALSGYSMDDVKVHYNSGKPAQLQALAYAQGTDIHVAPGQEQHLPHEAWHVVQQKQGRVQATMQMKQGVAVNDDKGLENEADVMGNKASERNPSPGFDRSISNGSYLNPVPSNHLTAPVQRVVSGITVGSIKLNQGTPNGKQAFDYLNIILSKFDGEIWFNSGQELEGYIKKAGKVEGIGVWDGRWMNFSGKGPIIFGEEHNIIRRQFMDSLRITHVVIEGVFEPSLAGVDLRDIPSHVIDPEIHEPYDGHGEGKALENFWTRSGLSMGNFWSEFENQLKMLNVNEPLLPQVERLNELQEIIHKIETITPQNNTSRNADEIEIIKSIEKAKLYLQDAKKAGLTALLDLMQENEKNPRMYVSKLPDFLRKNPNSQLLAAGFSGFKKEVEQIGYLNFKVRASPQELENDEITKNSTEPHTVWGGRRESFMIKNLEKALAQNPPPLLITMGGTHAKNKKQVLEEMISSKSGKLIIGSIIDLADYGALNPNSP